MGFGDRLQMKGRCDCKPCKNDAKETRCYHHLCLVGKETVKRLLTRLFNFVLMCLFLYIYISLCCTKKTVKSRECLTIRTRSKERCRAPLGSKCWPLRHVTHKRLFSENHAGLQHPWSGWQTFRRVSMDSGMTRSDVPIKNNSLKTWKDIALY